MIIKLEDDYRNELYEDIKNILADAINSIEKNNFDYNPWIKGRNNTCKWLGISSHTLNRMIVSGLPVHCIDGLENISFFNKDEINSFLLNM